jgi:hypothetical protein
MVKAYLRYELGRSFGVVTSGSALDAERSGKLAIAAANENISLWNLRQGTLVSGFFTDAKLLAQSCLCIRITSHPRELIVVCEYVADMLELAV